MPQPPKSPIPIQFGLSGWVGIISALATLALFVGAIAFLAVGLFVIFLPILLIVPILYYFLPHLKPKVAPLNGGATHWAKARQSSMENSGWWTLTKLKDMQSCPARLGRDVEHA